MCKLELNHNFLTLLIFFKAINWHALFRDSLQISSMSYLAVNVTALTFNCSCVHLCTDQLNFLLIVITLGHLVSCRYHHYDAFIANTSVMISLHLKQVFFDQQFTSLIDRSSNQRCSIKKGVLKNFAKITGKHVCQSLFFNKVAGLRMWTLTQVFSCEFAKFLKTPFS